MPRKPKSFHPLRVLRMVLDKSQAELATALGVSESLINATECGDKELSPRLAETVLAVYGIPIDQYDSIDPDDTEAIIMRAATFNVAVETWRRIAALASEDAPNAMDALFVPRLQALTKAAAKHGRGVAMLFALERWINEALQLLGPAVATAYRADEAARAPQYFGEGDSAIRSPWLSPEAEQKAWECLDSGARLRATEKRPCRQIEELAKRAGIDAETLDVVFYQSVTRQVEKSKERSKASKAKPKTTPQPKKQSQRGRRAS